MKKKISSIKLQNIDFFYSEDRPVFLNVTAEFPKNEVYWIKGKSGSGKSTFLKMLAGLIQANQGKFLYNDENICEVSFEEFLPYRLNIGYSFDFGGLISNKSIFENIALPLQYHDLMSPNEIQNAVDEVTRQFDLKKFELLRPSSIPGSGRKATIVARSLVLKPDLLLLDDPTTGLSTKNKKTLKNWIQKRRESQSLSYAFVVSEDRSFVEGLVTREVKVDDYKIESAAVAG